MFSSLIEKAKGLLPSPEASGLTSGRQVKRQSIDRAQVTTSSISPEIVANALRGAETGDLGRLQELYMRMFAEDAHIKGVVNSVRDPIATYPIRISPAKSRSPLTMQAAEMCQTNFDMLPMRSFLKSASLAHPYGLRIYELFYAYQDVEGGKFIQIVNLELVPPARYKMSVDEEEATFGEVHIATKDEPKGIPVSKLRWGKFIQIDDGTERGYYDLAGALRTCLFWWLAKTKNAQWWAEFNEIYGEPLRVGYYDEWMKKDEKDDLQQFLEQLSRAAWTMLPAEAEVQFIDMQKAGQVKTHSDMIGLANEEMSKALVGQIGTMGRSKYGSYGETGVLENRLYGTIQSVAGLIEDALNYMIHWLCQMNIDPNFPLYELPKAKIVIPNPEQNRVKAETFDIARKYMRIPAQYVHDEMGIPFSEDDDDILPGFGEESAVEDHAEAKQGREDEAKESEGEAKESEGSEDTDDGEE